MGQKIFAVIFALFLILFVAIVIEETFLGGRRRRKLEREARAKQNEALDQRNTRDS